VPLESDNLDFSVEWYFSDSGYLSAGFWEKRVNNFVGTSVVMENLYGLRDPTSGPDAQAALNFLISDQCRTQVQTYATANPAEDVDLDAACSANDTALFSALAMYRHESLAAYNGSEGQRLRLEGQYDLFGEADDPLYTFANQRP